MNILTLSMVVCLEIMRANTKFMFERIKTRGLHYKKFEFYTQTKTVTKCQTLIGKGRIVCE